MLICTRFRISDWGTFAFHLGPGSVPGFNNTKANLTNCAHYPLLRGVLQGTTANLFSSASQSDNGNHSKKSSVEYNTWPPTQHNPFNSGFSLLKRHAWSALQYIQRGYLVEIFSHTSLQRQMYRNIFMSFPL